MKVPDYPFFPAFVNLSNRRALVVGGGNIAARRVAALCQFCPGITVVAPALRPELIALGEAGKAAICKRLYHEADLEGADLVLACTDDVALNAEIAAACRRRGIPVNVASDQSLCDFLFPGVARSDDLVVGVTAGGKDHARAKRATRALRDYLEKESL